MQKICKIFQDIIKYFMIGAIWIIVSGAIINFTAQYILYLIVFCFITAFGWILHNAYKKIIKGVKNAKNM